MEECQDRLKILLSILYTFSIKVGYVSEEKTKYMILRIWNLQLCQSIKIDQYEFKFLSIKLTDKNEIANVLRWKNSSGK